jgi:4-amino-4-deoxy-L-arabinose transferase-like glycosyltransferase
MTEPRRFQLADVLTLVLVLVVAAGARGWYLLECADVGRKDGPIRVQDRPPLADPLTAARLVAAAGLGGFPNMVGALAPTPPAPPAEPELSSHAAPGYPWLRSLAKWAPEPDATVRWVQVALGALTAGLYFLFARRAFDSRLVGGLTGLFCALHPFWVVATGELADGVVAAFLLGLALWLGARGGQSGGALTSLLYGLSLAGLALVRAALLPFAFIALLWFLWRCRSLSRGWLFALVAFLGFANALVPWTVRNYRATGEVVPIVDTAWLHLWVGNNPDATGGAEDPAVLVRRLGEHDETAQPGYNWLASDVVDELRRDPAAAYNRRLWAGLSFVFGEQWLRQRTAWQPADSGGEFPSWLAGSYPALLTGTLLGMLVLAFVGWRRTFGWRRPSMPAALAVVWVPLPYLLSHAEALAGPRLPLDGVLLCLAAFTLVALLPRVGVRPEWTTDSTDKTDQHGLNP